MFGIIFYPQVTAAEETWKGNKIAAPVMTLNEDVLGSETTHSLQGRCWKQTLEKLRAWPHMYLFPHWPLFFLSSTNSIGRCLGNGDNSLGTLWPLLSLTHSRNTHLAVCSSPPSKMCHHQILWKSCTRLCHRYSGFTKGVESCMACICEICHSLTNHFRKTS